MSRAVVVHGLMGLHQNIWSIYAPPKHFITVSTFHASPSISSPMLQLEPHTSHGHGHFTHEPRAA